MELIDYEYYSDTFKGTDVSEDDFELLLDRAQDILDDISTGNIYSSTLSDYQLASIKKAVAYQIDFLYYQGGNDAMNGFAETNLSSEKLGSFSYSVDSSSKVNTRMVGDIPVSSMAYSKLKKANMLYAGF